MEERNISLSRLIYACWYNPLVVALVISASLLAGAYGFEYLGGMAPCDLCWTQRYAHLAILLFSAGGLLLKRGKNLTYHILDRATVMAVAASAAVAGYHAGIEQKWWPGPTTCTSDGMTQATDMSSLYDNMMGTKLVLCDQIPWEMFGISMAGYNFLISLALLLLISTASCLPERSNHD